jgi:ParB/RepB/Spo0J family partition protein
VQDKTTDIFVSLLDEPFLLMRPVLKNSVEYLERRDSIERRGFLNSILVRPSPRSPGRFEIIDGMWRFSAAVDLGRETIPCIIKHGLSDTDVIALQIQANAVRKDATPTEVARHLNQLMLRMPGVTAGQLSRLAGKHPTYVKDRLGLLALDQETQLMVDRGEIPAKSAYMLAKIRPKWRKEQVDNARLLPCKEFCGLAAQLIKQFAEQVQQGRQDERYEPDFNPHPYLRSLTEIKGELDSPQVGATIIVTENCRTPMDYWNAALRWMLQIDTASIERRKAAARALQHKDISLEEENDDESPPG